MKFVMLRALVKQTKVDYKGQTAINDRPYEDVETSSDYWTVFASKLLEKGWYDEVEIWYQEDEGHRPVNSFIHSTGMLERYKPEGFRYIKREIPVDVLFVRGDMKEYKSVIDQLPDAFTIYYPSGPYYCPSFIPDLSFVEDPIHIGPVKLRTGSNVELFKKSCVSKYFSPNHYIGKKQWDIAFVCCAPIAERKRLSLLFKILHKLPNVSAVVIGLTDEKLIKEAKGLNITWKGWMPRKGMNFVLSQCKIGLVLSTAEKDGCPRVIMEYLASGLPVVVSDKTCCSSIYVNRQTGFVASDEELPEAIEECLEISSFLDIRNYFNTVLSMGCSVRHFAETVKKHNGPINL